MEPCRFAVVGYGWRASFFLRLAALLPDRLEVCGLVVRRPEPAARAAQQWQVPVHPDVDALVAASRPEFVVTSVPWAVNPHLVRDLVGRGIPVLSETPPAPDLAALEALWHDVGDARLVQVAEQYHLMPGHAARRALVRDGVLGTPGQVHVSSTHDYHALSLIRLLLGVGYVPATIRASRFTAPLADPITRDGWRVDADPDAERPAITTLATIDFDGPSGLYDFTSNQWHNPLRTRRLLVRGGLGELDGETVTRLAGPRTVLTSRLERRQLGYDLDLDGYDTDHYTFEGRVLWRNPFVGLRLADEEIAIASLLLATADWVRDAGPPPYPLAQACEDHALSLAVHRAAESGDAVRVVPGPWAQDGTPVPWRG